MIELEIIREIKKISLNNENRFSFIAKYIINNLSNIVNMSIKEMASKTFTSIATINRFAKYLKLDGYKELLHIIKYFNSNFSIKIENEKFYFEKNLNINNENNLIINFYNNIIKYLNNTFDSILKYQLKIFDSFVNIIKESKKIVILAVGDTFNVAKDFNEKILRLGFNTIALSDFHIAYFVAKNLSFYDVALIISFSGETNDLIKISKICNEKKCPILLICKEGINSISKISKYVINIISDENVNRHISITSIFTILLALNILYFKILESDIDKYKIILNNNSINKF